MCEFRNKSIQVNNKVASSSSQNPKITYATVLKTPPPQPEQLDLVTSIKEAASIELTTKTMIQGIGSITSKALRQAKLEDRLIVGLSRAIKTLSNDPEETMFCILAQPKPGDSAAHMQVILLEAFCYENGIYSIKVDDMEKLSHIVGAPKLENCVLVQRFKHEMDNKKPLKLKFFDLEEKLIDHCEDYWDAQQKPIIRLPDE